MFFAHYSYMGFDPHSLTDLYTNYFENNRNLALINRAYATENPKKSKTYSAEAWGLTASDGPKGYMAKDLWSNKAKRDVLVFAAQGYLGKQSQPAGANAPGAALDPGLKNDLDELQRLGLTFGRKPSGAGPRAQLWIYLAAIAGWLVTACAVSMGAPFWFDVLNKISVVRSTIKPQEPHK